MLFGIVFVFVLISHGMMEVHLNLSGSMTSPRAEMEWSDTNAEKISQIAFLVSVSLGTSSINSEGMVYVDLFKISLNPITVLKTDGNFDAFFFIIKIFSVDLILLLLDMNK